MNPALSFEQAPPLRFFLAAPWFGVLAGLVLAWSGGDAFSSRWSPIVLAFTHLMTAGLMLQAMCGALLQFAPVATGANVGRPVVLGQAVQPLLALAALLLAAGFAFALPLLLVGAAALFVLAVGGFTFVVSLALWRATAAGMTLWALRCAVIALLLTVLLGGVLVMVLAWGVDVPLVALADVHLAWGLGGWALLLLAGVSWYVVPMFQLTPPYPLRFTRAFVCSLLVALAFVSLARVVDTTGWATAGMLTLLPVAASHAVFTLRLQRRRRRKLTDATFLFFRLAMLCLLVFVLVGVAAIVFPALGDRPGFAIGMGLLALVGVFTSAISGMLYKIIPFLGWLHLQRLGAPLSAVPNMKGMLDELAMRRQLGLHLMALVLLFAAVGLPWLVRPAGLVLAASAAMLGWNLMTAARRYVVFRDRIRAGGATHE